MDLSNVKLGNLGARDLAVVAGGVVLNFLGFDMTTYVALAAYFAFTQRS